MFQDNSIIDKKNIIGDIQVSKKYQPIESKINLLLKRYQNWKSLYTCNSKVSQSLNL